MSGRCLSFAGGTLGAETVCPGDNHVLFCGFKGDLFQRGLGVKHDLLDFLDDAFQVSVTFVVFGQIPLLVTGGGVLDFRFLGF